MYENSVENIMKYLFLNLREFLRVKKKNDR